MQIFLYQLFKDFVVRKHALHTYSSQVCMRPRPAPQRVHMQLSSPTASAHRLPTSVRYVGSNGDERRIRWLWQVAVSVCDHMLVVHALDSRVVLLFDVKINTQFAVRLPRMRM